jgi:hypothetical protein
MPLSSHLAPGFARLTYAGTRNPHHQIIPLNFAGVPTPGVSPEILPTGGTPIDAGGALLLYVSSCMASQFAAGTRIGAADVYSVDATTGIRTFIYTYDMDTIGTNVNPNSAFTESVWMFKSSVGKPVKIYMMEAVYLPDQRNVGSVPADARQDVLDYILSSDNIFYGRTDAYPLGFQTFTSKTNDVLRRNGGFTDV